MKKVLLHHKFLYPFIPIGIILIIGFAFRYYGINWDQGANLHPDERAIIMASLNLSVPHTLKEFLSTQSPLNPHFFAYGNLPMYLLKILSFLAGFIDPAYSQYTKAALVGRFISIFADVFTVLLVYKITYSISNRKLTAYISALCYTLAVFPIQAAHFYAVDTLLTFFITLTIYRIIQFSRSKSWYMLVYVGIAYGLAIATKISAVPLIIPILISIFLPDVIQILKRHTPKRRLIMTVQFIKQTVFYILIICAATAVVVVICEPYLIIDFHSFLEQNVQQSMMTKSAFTFPYTLQYVGKPNYIYELINMYWWGLGPVLFLLSLSGIFISFTKGIKSHQYGLQLNTIILSFLLLYFAIVGSFAVGWMRYMLPLYPLLCIYAGFSGSYILTPLYKQSQFFNKKLVISLAAFIVVVSIWPLSFMHIYANPNTRTQASQWIYKNITADKTIAIEHWDDELPIGGNIVYEKLILPLYEADTPSKWDDINNKLSQADYLIIASNRLYTPLQKLTNCKQLYPHTCYKQTAEYYNKLFDGQLDFQKIAEFSEYPMIPFTSITFNDQGADESFTVYDHPKVLIFKNTRR